MNQRFLLALVLTAIVLVITPVLFPRAKSPVVDSAGTTTPNATAVGAVASDKKQGDPSPLPPSRSVLAPSKPPVVASQAVGDSAVLQTRRARYVFASMGAVPTGVALDSYPSRRPGYLRSNASLIERNDRVMRLTLLSSRDTIPLDTVQFTKVANTPANTLEYTATVGTHPIRVRYDVPTSDRDDYLLHTTVEATGAPAGTALLITLAEKLFSNEPDTVDDLGHLGISYRPTRGGVESVGYSKLDSGEVRTDAGPINWVGLRNKYFLLAIRGVSSPFNAIALEGRPKNGRVASHLGTRILLPFQNGSAKLDIYAGPQDFERLQRLGGDLDQVNPYAGWFHGVVQPVAAIVMKVLLWMKRTTHLNYGWVLVLFGVAIRLLLWPLNQSAMRTSIRMQRLQPQLQALQKKHSDDPRKQQEAIMKLYKEHDMSPLSPLMGCLPMLLPMPVLFALYFVFNNTIEFRGVSFLWLPDISLRDPYYITPVFMGISMFVMSWIGMRNSPPNPQAKMMSYMMPVMLTALFLNFASGLNLYYAVQNVAAIPQQWLLARERGKNPVPVAVSAPAMGRKKPA